MSAHSLLLPAAPPHTASSDVYIDYISLTIPPILSQVSTSTSCLHKQSTSWHNPRNSCRILKLHELTFESQWRAKVICVVHDIACTGLSSLYNLPSYVSLRLVVSLPSSFMSLACLTLLTAFCNGHHSRGVGTKRGRRPERGVCGGEARRQSRG